MNTQELKAYITAKAQTDAALAALVAANDYAGIAASINYITTSTPTSDIGGYGTILTALWPDGGAVLNSLEAAAATDPNWKWAFKGIVEGRFDFGLPQAHAGWDTLVPALLTQAQADKLKAISPPTVTVDHHFYEPYEIEAALAV